MIVFDDIIVYISNEVFDGEIYMFYRTLYCVFVILPAVLLQWWRYLQFLFSHLFLNCAISFPTHHVEHLLWTKVFRPFCYAVSCIYHTPTLFVSIWMLLRLQIPVRLLNSFVFNTSIPSHLSFENSTLEYIGCKRLI